METVVTITGAELRDDPSARYFALVAYLAENRDSISDPELQKFWIIHAYDAEVLNGGHLQYFQNQGVKNAPAAIRALEDVGLVSHAEILRQALDAMNKNYIAPMKSFAEYTEVAMSEPFRVQDREYYRLSSSVMEALERYLGPKLETLVKVRSDA
jgi:HEPN domain-containing protein